MTPQERIAAIRERLERGDYPQPVIIDADAYPDLAWCADYIDHLLGIAEAAEKMADLLFQAESPYISGSQSHGEWLAIRDKALSAYDAALKVKP